jgi:hypothetical protein
MADNADTIVHQTPTRNPALTADLEAGLKSTPLALGSAAVSEHISTVGVECVSFSFVLATITHIKLRYLQCQ